MDFKRWWTLYLNKNSIEQELITKHGLLSCKTYHDRWALAWLEAPFYLNYPARAKKKNLRCGAVLQCLSNGDNLNTVALIARLLTHLHKLHTSLKSCHKYYECNILAQTSVPHIITAFTYVPRSGEVTGPVDVHLAQDESQYLSTLLQELLKFNQRVNQFTGWQIYCSSLSRLLLDSSSLFTITRFPICHFKWTLFLMAYFANYLSSTFLVLFVRQGYFS